MDVAEISADSACAFTDEVELSLRLALERGEITEILVTGWAHSVGVEPVPTLPTEILSEAAAFDPAVASAALSGRESIGMAIVRQTGELRWADERFRTWIGDPAESIGCNRLVRSTRVRASLIGLVQTEANGIITVLAATGAALDCWRPLLEDGAPIDRQGSVLLVAFAPSRSRKLVSMATRAYGLTAVEARLLDALLEAPNLESAARNAGVSRETARDTVARAARRAGVRTAGELVGRVIDLSCGAREAPTVDLPALQDAWGLSPHEARVALALTSGLSAKAAAARIGLSPQTVTTYRRAVFSKTGVNRIRDLRRLLAEFGELSRLAGAAEIVGEPEGVREQLRLLVDSAGRRIAFIDYGPEGARPVFLGHGYTTGRLAPPPLLEHLRRAGRRAIAVQRPGFGLTSPAGGDYLEAAAADAALVAGALKAGAIDIVARDGVAWVTAIVQRNPGLVRRVVLVNPRQPKHQTVAHPERLSAFSRLLAHQPHLIKPFAEMLRRQSRSELIARVLKGVSETAPSDRACIAAPGVLDFLIRDSQGMLARSIEGFVAEQLVYAEGWRLPDGLAGPQWVLAYSGALFGDPNLAVWNRLPGLSVHAIPDAGWLAQFTHPEVIVSLLD